MHVTGACSAILAGWPGIAVLQSRPIPPKKPNPTDISGYMYVFNAKIQVTLQEKQKCRSDDVVCFAGR